MNDTTPTLTTKRPRALPKVWQRFVYLEINDGFYIGRCAYVKTGFFEGTTRKDGSFRTIRVWPWTRVQTSVLVRDARPGGKGSSLPVWPPNMGETVSCLPPLDGCISDKRARIAVNDGITHYEGDDCPGGHCGCPEGPKGVEGQPGILPPHNDNNITGPTS